jgi:hypothetical protein
MTFCCGTKRICFHISTPDSPMTATLKKYCYSAP